MGEAEPLQVINWTMAVVSVFQAVLSTGGSCQRSLFILDVPQNKRSDRKGLRARLRRKNEGHMSTKYSSTSQRNGDARAPQSACRTGGRPRCPYGARAASVKITLTRDGGNFGTLRQSEDHFALIEVSLGGAKHVSARGKGQNGASRRS